ncbi:MAG: carotenoid biosynthesis protein [Pseudomonadota bacterium]
MSQASAVGAPVSTHQNPAFRELCWLIIAAWTLTSLTSILAPAVLPYTTARYINVALMTGFTFFHGVRRYGWVNITAFFVIGVVITNLTENLSIVTGFPFGHYSHTELMGPKLWHVPLIVGPIFAVAGYVAWVLAGILLGEPEGRQSKGLMAGKGLIAAFITTSWDFCVDPIGGTLNRDWVWANGGGYFGVPWINFFGWMLTMWLIFLAFGAFLAARGGSPAPVTDRRWLAQPVVFWALIGLQFPLLLALAPTGVTVTDPAGTVWAVDHLLETMALSAFFTMLFTALLCALLLTRTPMKSAPGLSQR